LISSTTRTTAALVAREAELHARLKRMGDGLPQLQGIFVVGSDGHMIATNRAFPAPHALDLSDRASFGHHLQGGTAPFISEVLTSRTTGEPFFDVSVRRPRASGNFGGVASTSMAPKYFSAFYRDLAASDSQLNLALLRSDGQLLAGWPKSADSADASGGDSPEIRPASMEGRDAAAQGGVESSRFRASRPIGAYPMTVVAWIEEPAVLAPWYRQIALLFALDLATGIALFSMSRVALQRTRRSLQAADELKRETINRERVEEALRQAQKLEAMGRLTGGVAHDFNNLLAVVSTNLYLLKHLEPKSAETPQMAAIERAVKAGTKLTRQLLSFSRRQPLVTEQLLLQERLPDMVELLGQALGSGIAVETELDANAGPVELDAAELELALLNLALNARDAMPDGGRLRIALARAASDPALTTDQSAVVVSVTDTGHGIPEHLRERVFEPFFTTKPAGVGTGLGLSQVYGFVRRAGGSGVAGRCSGEGNDGPHVLPGVYSPETGIGRRPGGGKSVRFDRVKGVGGRRQRRRRRSDASLACFDGLQCAPAAQRTRRACAAYRASFGFRRAVERRRDARGHRRHRTGFPVPNGFAPFDGHLDERVLRFAREGSRVGFRGPSQAMRSTDARSGPEEGSRLGTCFGSRVDRTGRFAAEKLTSEAAHRRKPKRQRMDRCHSRHEIEVFVRPLRACCESARARRRREQCVRPNAR
jgi:signal transduction histidine kinase